MKKRRGDRNAERFDTPRDTRPDEPRPPELRPFVGRSRGVITATREDLLGPVGENWEVGEDL